MRNYTTLGTGKATKVLAVADHFPARTVTTASVTAAGALARALEATDRQMPAALFDIAVELDGAPVEARRRLLNVFDTVADGNDHLSEGNWVIPDALVIAVASAVTAEPAPVIAAARAELEDHLGGFDGVLVPARADSGARRASYIDLVISGPLDWMGDQFWDYLLGEHGDLELGDEDPDFAVPGDTVCTTELYGLAHELYDAEPVSTAYATAPVSVLLNEGTDNDMLTLAVNARHFTAWVAHHRPDDVDKVTAALS